MNSEYQRAETLKRFTVADLAHSITAISIKAKLELIDTLISYEAEVKRQYGTPIV